MDISCCAILILCRNNIKASLNPTRLNTVNSVIRLQLNQAHLIIKAQISLNLSNPGLKFCVNLSYPGFAANQFGGKYLFGLGVFATAMLTLATPLFASMGSDALIAARVFEGLFEVRVAALLVCMHYNLSNKLHNIIKL